MKALLVIDMQEDYVGENRNKKRHPYEAEELIANINTKIVEYQKNGGIIIYIRNKKKFNPVSELVKGGRIWGFS